ncbi:hypothetical protein [Spirosoma luteum]|uniref:hypothetical protein n=1 Tax=Spirosoma luteum TaxID=431553 RepID=UPI00036E3B40|nr:hypothetical protein [Spirosoma luteum]
MNTSAFILDQIYAFLAEIGIPVSETTLSQSTFVPGILIDQGRLLVDPAKLLYPGNLLHEAGHIAVTLPAERWSLYEDVTLGRPDKQGDELAVILWTYAACQQIGIPAAVVFHPAGYKGDSEWLLGLFAQETYVGLPLLVWMGMTLDQTVAGGFPQMTSWLRP